MSTASSQLASFSTFGRSVNSFLGAAVTRGPVSSSLSGVASFGLEKKPVPLARSHSDHHHNIDGSSSEFEIGKLLDSLRPGLKKYAQKLVDGEIYNMEDLEAATETYLMQLGVLPHHARQILNAVQEKQQGIPSLPTFSLFICGKARCIVVMQLVTRSTKLPWWWRRHEHKLSCMITDDVSVEIACNVLMFN